jgi:2-polyprenyl-6-methoxyphenol hydroxylase-like FAD-dependent oxidoreductase
VGADGVNSTVRQVFANEFKPDLSTRPNKYIWYGTRQLFHGLTLTFRETREGRVCGALLQIRYNDQHLHHRM